MAEFYHSLGTLLMALGLFFLAVAVAMVIAFGFYRPYTAKIKEAVKNRMAGKPAVSPPAEKKGPDRTEKEKEVERETARDGDVVSPSSDLSGDDTDQSTLAPEESSFEVLEEVMIVHDGPENYRHELDCI